MTADADALFVDTNVLVFASIEESLAHQVALSKLEALTSSGRELWISRQVIREYLAVLTRPGYFQCPLPREAVLEAAADLTARFRVADETDGTTKRMLELTAQCSIGGRNIHDCNIVASMLEHGVRILLTDNRRNFAAFAGLIRIEDLR